MKLSYIFFSLFALSLFQTTSAQQLPMLNQAYYNRYLFNPACAGITPYYGNVYLDYQRQWINMPDAPNTQTITVDMPLARNRMGVGLNLYRDQAYIIQKNGAMLSYAYHIPLEGLGEEHRFSGGLSLGFLQQNINFADAPSHDANDPALLTNNVNKTSVDFSLGLNYQNRRFNMGLAAKQLGNNNLLYNNNDQKQVSFRMLGHYFFNASYDIRLADSINLTPYISTQWTPGIPLQLDGSLILDWKKKMWLGTGMRTSNYNTFSAALNATLGVRIMKAASFSYNIQVPTGFGNELGLTHELLLGFRFGNDVRHLENMVADLKREEENKSNEIALLNRQVDSLKNANNKQDGQLSDLSGKDAQLDLRIDSVNHRIDTLSLYADRILAQENEDQFQIKYLHYLLKNERYKEELADDLEFELVGSTYFASSKTVLTPEAKARLRNIKEIIDAQDYVLKIYIIGHASNKGSASQNVLLSMRRTVAVRDYLHELGISEDRFLIIPHGAENPLTNTEEIFDDPLLERRVDVFIIGDDDRYPPHVPHKQPKEPKRKNEK